MKKVLLFLIDALGYDAISDHTPWLLEQKNKNHLASMKPILGYSDAQRVTLFSGLHPENTGYWMLHRFSPEDSPFRLIQHLGFVDKIPWGFGQRGFKYVASRALSPLLRRFYGYQDVALHNMPFAIAPLFAPTLQGSIQDPNALTSVPTIFDVLRQNGKSFASIDSSSFGLRYLFRSAADFETLLHRELDKTDENTEFIYLYIHSLDMIAHRVGIDGARYQRELPTIDAVAKRLTEHARERFGPELETIIVSDHGLNRTQTFVNYEQIVRHPKHGKDFLCALDSTMVRLWYFTTSAKEEIHHMLNQPSYGHFLSQIEKKGLGVGFNHRLYGDDIYLLEPGFSIFPNYHSLLRPLAMHAYHPDIPDQQAIAVLLGNRSSEVQIAERAMDITDIFPTILDILELPIPKGYPGQSAFGPKK